MKQVFTSVASAVMTFVTVVGLLPYLLLKETNPTGVLVRNIYKPTGTILLPFLFLFAY